MRKKLGSDRIKKRRLEIEAELREIEHLLLELRRFRKSARAKVRQTVAAHKRRAGA